MRDKRGIAHEDHLVIGSTINMADGCRLELLSTEGIVDELNLLDFAGIQISGKRENVEHLVDGNCVLLMLVAVVQSQLSL